MSGDSTIIAMLQNAGLILTMGLAFEAIGKREPRGWSLSKQFVAGVTVGLIAAVMMVTSMRHPTGVILDTRSVILATSGLFLGTIPTVAAIAITAIFRLAIDGTGTATGIAVIVTSGLIGIVWRRRKRGTLEQITLGDLLALGIVVHLVMLGLLYFLLGPIGPNVVRDVGVAVMLVHPVATAALGLLLARRLKHWRTIRELNESEARLRLALEAANQGTFDLDVATGVSRLSEQYASILGEEPRAFDETLEQWYERLHPEDLERIRGALRDYLEGRSPVYRVETRRRRRDGSWVWTLSTGTIVERDAAGRATRMIGAIQDITHLKNAELEARAAQRESERLLADAREARAALLSILEDQQHARHELEQARHLAQSTLDALSHNICVLDETGRIVAVNQAWRDFASSNGAPAGESYVGWNYIDLCDHVTGIERSDAQKVAARLRAIFAGEVSTFSSEYECSSPEQERWFHLQLTRFEADGKARVVVAHENVTERRKTEEERLELTRQLFQAQKLESVGSLAGGIAHDLNNVLAAISNAASTHLGRLAPEDPLSVALSTITSACARGRSVVQSLLYFARREQGTRGPVDLNAVALEIVALLEQTTLKRVRLLTSLDPELEPIEGDAAALGHALMNLCLNSVDAMPGGGDITISTRRVEGSMVELSVRDNGQGMPEEVRRRAVEPFFTTKPIGKGTGLGLAMVYGTARSHDGSLEIRSAPGEGTEVILTFPAIAGPRETFPVPPPSVDAGARIDTLRILVVDDDELILESLPPLLESLGHEAVTVNRGLAAIEKLRSGLAPDVVILDMNMPGLTGVETMTRIFELRPEQPIIVSTGYSDVELPAELLRSKRVRSLRKPFTGEELDAALRLLLTAPGDAGQV